MTRKTPDPTMKAIGNIVAAILVICVIAVIVAGTIGIVRAIL